MAFDPMISFGPDGAAIDDLHKVDLLMAGLKRVLPVEARMTDDLRRTLSKQSPDLVLPPTCNVSDVIYTGDEGGVICTLDIGGPEVTTVHLVSITHLRFDRRTPGWRDIDAYQRHRTKKLKRLAGRGF